MTLINTGGTTLSGSGTTISSIPGTYTDLRLIVVAPIPATNGEGAPAMQFNGDTGTSYTSTDTTEYRESWNQTRMYMGGETNNSGTNGITNILIPDYARSGPYRTCLTLTTAQNAYVSGNVTSTRTMGFANITSAITSITLLPNSGNWTSGTVYVYGVK